MDLNPNIIIYILCYDEITLSEARKIYNSYYWARPILMKYQDVTFENAFWTQLLEIKPEWEEAEMVGTISWKAYIKRDITNINNIIISKKYRTPYHNFFETPIKYEDDKHIRTHKYLKSIIHQVTQDLYLNLPETVSYSNYFMCSPKLMIEFIDWFKTRLLPSVILNEDSFSDANYEEATIGKGLCLEKWGYPYYPLIPFILERLNGCFFLPGNNLVNYLSR